MYLHKSILILPSPVGSKQAGEDFFSFIPAQQQSLGPEFAALSTPESQYDQDNVGFLGHTSYAAVYTEHATSSGIGLENHTDPASSSTRRSSLEDTAMAPVRIQRGATLLASLNDLSLIERLADRWCRVRQALGAPKPLIRAAILSLRASYEAALSTARVQDLTEISNRICLNSQQPYRIGPATTVSEYIESFVGQNLRWEILGILFSVAGASAMTLSDQDKSIVGRDNNLIDRKSFVSQMMSNSDDVLSFCDHYRQPNDLMLWLMFENFSLVTLHHGDSSKSYRFILSDLPSSLKLFRFDSFSASRRSLYHRACYGTSSAYQSEGGSSAFYR